MPCFRSKSICLNIFYYFLVEEVNLNRIDIPYITSIHFFTSQYTSIAFQQFLQVVLSVARKQLGLLLTAHHIDWSSAPIVEPNYDDFDSKSEVGTAEMLHVSGHTHPQDAVDHDSDNAYL
jgi:hypothetical protein